MNEKIFILIFQMKGIHLLKELMESKMQNFEKTLEKFQNINEYTIKVNKLSETNEPSM